VSFQILELLTTTIATLPRESRIADLGCGAGASWWGSLPEGCTVDAYDVGQAPPEPRRNIRFIQRDVTRLKSDRALRSHYELVVADHVFEHVRNPDDLAASIHAVLKNGGHAHIGVPDATNFTDKFYHLIHRDSGGHVSLFSRESFVALMEKHGFSLVDTRPWPDDWAWLERLFSIERYGIQDFTKQDLQYIVDVFRKELTPEKGYLYGWEFLFRKA